LDLQGISGNNSTKRQSKYYAFRDTSLAAGAASILLDEKELIQQERKAHLERLTTPSGFIWPAPRLAAEDHVHPWKPSPQRIDGMFPFELKWQTCERA